jgi:hypothetical protein
MPGLIDLTGQRFGRLVALERAGAVRVGSKAWIKTTWLFRCDCGKEVVIISASVTTGLTQSCGCLNRERTAEALKKRRLDKGEASFNALLRMYKNNARAARRPFTLTSGDFRALTQQPCHYCGVLPSNIYHREELTSGPYVYSGIDRVDNERGYELDNVVACCVQCNYAKRKLSQADFLAWIRRVYEHTISEQVQERPDDG